MRTLVIGVFLIVTTSGWGQMDSLLLGSKAAQEKINQSYLDPERSVLLPEDFENFTGLEFYPIDSKYIVEAEFVRTPDEKPFLMPTTTERLPEYVKYGEAHFQLEGKNLVLSLFKATDRESNYLFLPFTDLTSGDGSYGGGRYLDFELPVEDVLLIDFNKAYNPYCTYNPRYSCPIPPEENDLLVRIEAGVKDFKIP